jgi:hypothetical protein
MGRASFGSYAFALIVIAIGLGLCYGGVFYQTGAQFYEACWQKAHANNREPDSPEQAARWATCGGTTDDALFNAGFIFSGNPVFAVTPQLKAVDAACPSNYSDLPMDGAWYLAVKMIQDSGGPVLLDRITPARSAIVRVFESKWPRCAATATANGFPKLVKRNGNWEFATTCVPCKPQEQAVEKHFQDVREWDSKPAEEKERLRDQWREKEVAAEQHRDVVSDKSQ